MKGLYFSSAIIFFLKSSDKKISWYFDIFYKKIVYTPQKIHLFYKCMIYVKFPLKYSVGKYIMELIMFNADNTGKNEVCIADFAYFILKVLKGEQEC